MYIKNIRVFVCISFFPFEPTIVFSYGTSFFFLLYNIFKLAHPFVRQFPTAWWYLSDIAGNARSVSSREARPTVGVRRCRFDWKWFLENKSKKKLLHVIPKFWFMYIGLSTILLTPPLWKLLQNTCIMTI